jgi:iron-sulfur cluster repair protein YtfE (RIC family)
MEPQLARRILLTQHELLHGRLADCSALARRLRDGEPVLGELEATLTDLRGAFAEHNALESSLIEPLLRGSPRWGKVLVDRMLEEHVAEHAAFWSLLAGTTDDVASRMDDLVDELDAHMAAEERTFLSPQVLRDDVLARRSAPE